MMTKSFSLSATLVEECVGDVYHHELYVCTLLCGLEEVDDAFN